MCEREKEKRIKWQARRKIKLKTVAKAGIQMSINSFIYLF